MKRVLLTHSEEGEGNSIEKQFPREIVTKILGMVLGKSMKKGIDLFLVQRRVLLLVDKLFCELTQMAMESNEARHWMLTTGQPWWCHVTSLTAAIKSRAVTESWIVRALSIKWPLPDFYSLNWNQAILKASLEWEFLNVFNIFMAKKRVHTDRATLRNAFKIASRKGQDGCCQQILSHWEGNRNIDVRLSGVLSTRVYGFYLDDYWHGSSYSFDEVVNFIIYLMPPCESISIRFGDIPLHLNNHTRREMHANLMTAINKRKTTWPTWHVQPVESILIATHTYAYIPKNASNPVYKDMGVEIVFLQGPVDVVDRLNETILRIISTTDRVEIEKAVLCNLMMATKDGYAWFDFDSEGKLYYNHDLYDQLKAAIRDDGVTVVAFADKEEGLAQFKPIQQTTYVPYEYIRTGGMGYS